MPLTHCQTLNLMACLCRLPACFRSNLAACFVLHCDLSLWAASMALMPWLSGGLWRKVTWISRMEFLWDYCTKVGAKCPRLGAPRGCMGLE